jgi:ribosomal RNA-processing protein 12
MASNTSHMRSAAVMAMSRLIFECVRNDETLLEFLPSLLKTVLVLSDDPSREVFKSVVGFVRVSVGVATPEQLEPLLPDILGSLLNYGRGKDRFRAKIKIIIKKLVKVFGYEALMPFVPASDTRLLTHMRKLSERDIRRKRMRRERRDQEPANFDEMVASDEEDSDDGMTLLTAATRMSRMTKQSKKRGRGDRTEGRSTRSEKTTSSIRIKHDADGEVQDMTDLTRAAWNVDDLPSDEDDDDDDDVRIDDSGMIVVSDAPPKESLTQDLMDLRRHNSSDTKSQAQSAHTSKSQKSKGQGKSKQQQLGAAYKARKAGGDTKKKSHKYDPYAYVPLDGRSYTKKNRRNAVEQMSSVVYKGRKRQKR